MQRRLLRTGAPSSELESANNPETTTRQAHRESQRPSEWSFILDLNSWEVIEADSVTRDRLGAIEMPCSVDAILSAQSAGRLGRIATMCLRPGESWTTRLLLGPRCPEPQTVPATIHLYGGEPSSMARVIFRDDTETAETKTHPSRDPVIDLTEPVPDRDGLEARLSELISDDDSAVAVIVAEAKPGVVAAGVPGLAIDASNPSAGSTARLDDERVASLHRVTGRDHALLVARNLSARRSGNESDEFSPAAVGVTLVFDKSEAPDAVIARAAVALEKAKISPRANIVIAEPKREVDAMTTRIPLKPTGTTRPSNVSTNGYQKSSVRRMRLDQRTAPTARRDEHLNGSSDTAVAGPYSLHLPSSQRIDELVRLGWGPLRPTVDLGTSAGPAVIGISGTVPAIESRDAARQLLQAAVSVEPGALPFSARTDSATAAPFIAAAAQLATIIDVTRHAVGVEIDAPTVRRLDFAGVENLRALNQEGVAITIGRLDSESAHRSFFEAAAARIVTIDIAGMSQDRLAQMIAIATHSDIAVIAEGVNTAADLTMVTKAGCRYAEGALFVFDKDSGKHDKNADNDTSAARHATGDR